MKMNFSEVAKGWDTVERVARGERIAKEIALVCKNEGLHKMSHGLEFGCGTGLVGLYLAPMFEKLTMNDDASGMIEVLSEKIQQLEYNHINGVCEDIHTLLKKDAKYDFIFSSMVIHHIDRVDLLMEAFSMRQNAGDYMCFVDLDEDFDGHFHSGETSFGGHHGFKQEVIQGFAENAGYEVKKLYSFYEGTKKKEDRESKYSLFILLAQKR